MRAINLQLAAAAHLWLHAARLVGLRPCEWRYLHLESRAGSLPGGAVWLVVRSAKITNGRSSGPVRRIDLSTLSSVQRDTVLCWLAHVDRLGLTGFHRLQRRVTCLFTKANTIAFPERRRCISLYTARHLCASSAKRTMNVAEVAALLGHGSVATASEFYGRRAPGRVAPPVARPDPALAAAIAAKNLHRPAPRRPSDTGQSEPASWGGRRSGFGQY